MVILQPILVELGYGTVCWKSLSKMFYLIATVFVPYDSFAYTNPSHDTTS